MINRAATHAGSWYSKTTSMLTSQLDSFIADTPEEDHARPGCRVIISPHAGYSYSGPTAAFGFKAIDWTNIKRVFVLGPSHHVYIKSCALSPAETLSTPLGELQVDTDMIAELKATKAFDQMTMDVDEDEHSIEMQLPYLRHVMPKHRDIPLVPIMVGSLDRDAEAKYGKLLSTYVKDECNAFVISSDFCHWGNRFSYTYYKADGEASVEKISKKDLRKDVPIWKSIEVLDHEGIEIIKSGSHKNFTAYLARTRNTICGRHPIGVLLAAMEDAKIEAGFSFLDYRQSNQVTSPSDGSVSYASGILCPDMHSTPKG